MATRDFGITDYELEIYFRRCLNQEQIRYITKLIVILGKYMVLSRQMINLRAGEEIGLKYVAMAVENGLITELRYKDGSGLKNIYFFHLNYGGIRLCEKDGYFLNKLPLSADDRIKSRIVTLNKWLLENNLDLDERYKIDRDYSYFHVAANKSHNHIIGYFKESISEDMVARILLKKENQQIISKLTKLGITGENNENIKKLTLDDILKRYKFVPINIELVKIGNKSSSYYFSHFGDCAKFNNYEED